VTRGGRCAHNSPSRAALFHELAHLLSHTSGIDPLDDQYVQRFQQNIEQKKLLHGGKMAAPFVIARGACEKQLLLCGRWA
jgi:hypothetical protein